MTIMRRQTGYNISVRCNTIPKMCLMRALNGVIDLKVMYLKGDSLIKCLT